MRCVRAYEKRWGRGMDKGIELYGWLAARNLNIDCLGDTEDLGECVQYNHLLDKFPEDRIFYVDTDRACFMDGYVVNKGDFAGQWQEAFVSSAQNDMEAHLKKLRGGFCGYFYQKKSGKLTIYTDHTSNKAIYYYCEKDRWIASNCVDFMVRVLKANRIAYHFNPRAAQYMLTYGYMLDGSTFIREIHRLMPGQYADITDGQIYFHEYYKIPYAEESVSEDEAIERIDAAFRQAVIREFEKDREYGYRHLVDLSGGIDSRMVSWVAHELGYTDQVNVTYSRLEYVDQKIAGRIARDLGHEYIYKSLDDIRWMYDIDEMTCRNNGASICLGITGGNRLLCALNTNQFGLEHTGMQGGATLASYYKDKALNYAKPKYGYNQYSNRLSYDFGEELLAKHPTQESFVTYTRGLLGTQSSYLIRQHYVETAAPFQDVDFLDMVFRLPFKYRDRRYIYLKWIAAKYPKAAEYGWEKWGGVKPKHSHVPIRKVKTTQKLITQYGCHLLHIPNKDSMNPMDYWYEQNMELQRYLQDMFEKRIGSSLLDEQLRQDIADMYKSSSFTDKCLALTVLSAIHLFFENEGAEG